MAPEICDPNVKSYSAKVADVWALGITCYGFTFNSMPFWGENELEIMGKIQKNDVIIPEDERNISQGLKDMIKSMLIKDPKERISIDQVL